MKALRTLLHFLVREWPWWVVPLVLALLVVAGFLLLTDHEAHRPFVYTQPGPGG